MLPLCALVVAEHSKPVVNRQTVFPRGSPEELAKFPNIQKCLVHSGDFHWLRDQVSGQRLASLSVVTGPEARRVLTK